VEAEVETLLQTIIVAVMVLGSAVFAAWRLTPAKTRYRMLSSLSFGTESSMGRWVGGLKKKAADELSHGCGACSSSSTKKPSIAGRPRH
jgi:hypothetical protein